MSEHRAAAPIPAEVIAEREQIQSRMKKLWGWVDIDPETLSVEEKSKWDGKIGLVRFNPSGRPEPEPHFAKMSEFAKARWKLNPPPPATVFNFLPIPLRSDSHISPLKWPGCEVPSAEGTSRFSVKTFDDPFLEPTAIPGVSVLTTFEWWPIHFAEEFVKLNPRGVFALAGPSDSAAVQAKLDKTEQAAIAWMREQIKLDREYVPPATIEGNAKPGIFAQASKRRLLALGLPLE